LLGRNTAEYYAAAVFNFSDRGATSAEYAILVAGIATVIVIAVTALGTTTLNLFQPVASFFSSLH